jgi:hypothetical protein
MVFLPSLVRAAAEDLLCLPSADAATGRMLWRRAYAKYHYMAVNDDMRMNSALIEYAKR